MQNIYTRWLPVRLESAHKKHKIMNCCVNLKFTMINSIQTLIMFFFQLLKVNFLRETINPLLAVLSMDIKFRYTVFNELTITFSDHNAFFTKSIHTKGSGQNTCPYKRPTHGIKVSVSDYSPPPPYHKILETHHLKAHRTHCCISLRPTMLSRDGSTFQVTHRIKISVSDYSPPIPQNS